MDVDRIIREVTNEIGMTSTIACKDADVTSIPEKLEHSLLNPDISKEKIIAECELARKYRFATICVSPYYTSLAFDVLRDSRVLVCSVVGFPQGAISSKAKLEEVKECIVNGARELDVAMNILAIKSGEFGEAKRDLEQVVRTAQGKASIKAVYEQGAYTAEEKVKVLEMIKACGADFVKIQNVMSKKAASAEDILFVRNIVGRNVRIKIDGGVKTVEHAKDLFLAGADRIGLTASVEIAKQCI